MAAVHWDVAASLDKLLEQINTIAPHRSKASDGSIGDANHANRSSDHNPWYPPPAGGLVTARDFTHDPAGGLDCDRLANELVASRDPRIKYVIWEGQIADHRRITRTIADKPITHPAFTWLPYSGPNPHRHHLHLSVIDSPLCTDDSPWPLPMFAPAIPPPEDSVTYRLDPTPTPAGADPNAQPTAQWPTTEDVIATPGPTGGWRGRILMHPVFGFGGGFVQEAWSGPSGRHYVNWDHTKQAGGRYIPAFASPAWELAPGDKFLVIRYAAPRKGSVGVEAQK